MTYMTKQYKFVRRGVRDVCVSVVVYGEQCNIPNSNIFKMPFQRRPPNLEVLRHHAPVAQRLSTLEPMIRNVLQYQPNVRKSSATFTFSWPAGNAGMLGALAHSHDNAYYNNNNKNNNKNMEKK